MNYFEHHIGDYDQATAHLTACEDGIYGRLIRWYMASEQPLPSDIKAIQRRVRAHSKEERDAVQTVLGEFFELREDGWHQHRCDSEIARFKDKQRKAKASADARWSKADRTSERNANASQENDAGDMRTHTERIADGMHRAPVPRLQTPDPITHPEDASYGGSPQSDAPPPPPSDQACLQIEIAGGPIVSNPQEGPKSGSGARNVGRLVPAPSPPPFDGENAEILNGKAVVPLAAAWELPTQWGEDAEALGFKVADVIREAEKFRQYWVSGKGAGTRRNVKGWRQCWSNWLAKASERAQR